MDDCFGREVARLMQEYIEIHSQLEYFEYLHYFCQGHLAAQAE